MERIIAIADYFLSFEDEISFERRSILHTSEFYSQLSNLAKQGHLRQIMAKKGDPANVSYFVLAEYAMVEEVANSVGIRLFEYLYHAGIMAFT
jgi:hypothetical protein